MSIEHQLRDNHSYSDDDNDPYAMGPDDISINSALKDDEINIFEAIRQYSFPNINKEILNKLGLLSKYSTNNRMYNAKFRCEPSICDIAIGLNACGLGRDRFGFLSEFNKKYNTDLTREDFGEPKSHLFECYVRVGKIKREWLDANIVEIKRWEGEEWIELNVSALKIHRINKILSSDFSNDKKIELISSAMNGNYEDIQIKWYWEYKFAH